MSDFRDLASNAIANEKQVKDKLDSVKSAEEIFNTFIQKIDDREVQLEGQNEKTNSYQEKLTSFGSVVKPSCNSSPHAHNFISL